MCDCVTGISCALRWGVALVGDIFTKLCPPCLRITLSGTREDCAPSRRECEECRVVALNTMFVKYIGTICFDIFWFVKELYIKILYNNMGICMFARKKIKK